MYIQCTIRQENKSLDGEFKTVGQVNYEHDFHVIDVRKVKETRGVLH